ncbi:TetR/AcrR family transcriptional regulator [Amycolatopsis sp. EV170708-02-1]|uniref:TetR/AcrR family transcriptional regulator n=1 Tax=Amycolatopsis sp. EV170708-02-1 TaxID=2919322 RepID=UPI001F0CA5FB|nr:TetR/AcrR family transcriptional regulator [Amycolatopsis sp. EV170708-02-1]UMP01288.1 TetR/AcrR family transcriptional regulator [Amycolatopsis sp. EV170708-02-1]
MSADHIDGRRARYQHRRPELLEAVTGYVLSHGLAGLAMRPLAVAVGVSHGTLLHHFGSKENLVTEVIDVLRRRLGDAAGLSGSPARLTSLVSWWRDSTTTERLPIYRLLFEVFAQAARDPERYERFLQQVVRDSLTLMESLVIADGCPRDQAPLMATMIVAQARGLQLDLLATGDRERVDRTFALFVDLIDHLMRSRPHEHASSTTAPAR